MRVRSLVLAATVAAGMLSACGGGSGGPPTLTWYINPDNGSQVKLADECTAASNGAFRIKTSVLPRDASQQRQQLVQRLAAKDKAIDLMSIDPVFVAEFAEAGFLADVPQGAEFTDGVVQAAVDASSWKGKLVAIPFWANTQLLWYRKSVAQQAGLDMTKPVTWDQVIKAAKSAGKTVGVQADRYEGYTVWINALVSGAGGKIVQNPGALASNLDLGLDSDAGRAAAAVIQQVVQANVGGPSLSTSQETQALDLFSSDATSGFLVNWPYTWAAMADTKVPYRDNDVGWARYPQTVEGQESHPPFGGIELGIGKFSKHQQEALAAAKCITSVEHQTEYMVGSGNPAANKKVYDNAEVRKNFPMADLIRDSLDAAAPRPQSQYYGDLSTALQKSFSPPNRVNDKTPAQASEFILQVLKGERLL